MKSNSFAKKVLKICRQANAVAISGHVNPDYDALGSCLALQNILAQNGVAADIILEEALDRTFEHFASEYEFTLSPDKAYDVFISVDTAEVKLLPEKAQAIRQKASVTINIDHHISNENHAELNFVQADKSSACEVLYYLFRGHFRLDQTLARFLYIGIYTDTGGFVYSNTQEGTFLCLADILSTEFAAEKLLQDCFRTKSRAAYEITKRAFDSIKFYHDDKIVVSVLREKDFLETGANLNESKFIVSYLPTIEGVMVSISVSEPKKNDFHVSLRTSLDTVDVSSIASKFGGGGHKRASGLTLRGDFDKAINALISHAKHVLESNEN